MKKKIIAGISYVLLIAIALTATVAYFTDTDSAVNVMTVGQIDIEQLEYQRAEGVAHVGTATEGSLVPFKQAQTLLPAFPVNNLATDYSAEPYDLFYWGPYVTADAAGNGLWNDNKLGNVMDKMVFVKNTGKNNAYYRTIFAFECPEGMEYSEGANEEFMMNTNLNHRFEWENVDYITIDGVRYLLVLATYKEVLAPEEISRPSLLQVVMTDKATQEQAALLGDTYEILVYTQAVQADMGVAMDADTALDAAFGDITAANHPWDAAPIESISGKQAPMTLKDGDVVILSDVTIEATDSAAITVEGDATIIATGKNTFVGAAGYSAIDVKEGATLTLNGNTIAAIGNGGVDTTDKGGSGIGGKGNIVIENVDDLTAKGFGKHAAGIGGQSKSIVIRNSTVTAAQGGFVQPLFINDEKYGKSEPEGGAAIGSSTGGAVITLDHVTVKDAKGGSKAAAIGGSFWTAVTVNISDSNILNAEGGNASAGIGGGRYAKDEAGLAQAVVVNIADSKVNAKGGQFGAGIGSGYNTHCLRVATCVVNITGDSEITAVGGKYAAGIGTGFHVADLDGEIASTVTVNAVSGDKFYKDTYTQAQNIGFGVADPTREALNNNSSILYNGAEIAIPSV